MTTDNMIRELHRLEALHRDDFVGTGETNWASMCRDVANRLEELLKAQTPRVMTLEEVKSLERDTVVWYEHDGVNKQRPRIVDQAYDSGIIFTDGGHWRFNADAYGKKFRLWTSRPTDAQREGTPWN